MKSIYKHLLPAIVGCFCLFCGCGNSPAASDIADETAQNAILQEAEAESPKQETVQTQGADTEIPDEKLQDDTEETEAISDEVPWKKLVWQDCAPAEELSSEEIAFDYKSFLFLSGMSVDELQKATNRELNFSKYWRL